MKKKEKIPKAVESQKVFSVSSHLQRNGKTTLQPNVSIQIPCGPAMLSQRKSSGDPPGDPPQGVSGFFGLNHW